MITNSRLAYQSHDHQRCINAAISQAEILCKSRNARLTPIRRDVLKVIWQSHQPLGAYAIAEKLNESTERRILAPTVYRAIEFLTELGLIHRIASLNAYMGCPFPGSEHSDFFMICRKCGGAAECSAEGINSVIADIARRANFQLESQSLEISGLCSQCQEPEPQEPERQESERQ